MRTTRVVLLALILILVPSCGDDDASQTLGSLREENRGLREGIGRLEANLEAERREFAARLAALRDELAEKSLRASALERENQALDAAFKSDPELRAWLGANFQGERLIYWLIMLVLGSALALVWRRYRESRTAWEAVRPVPPREGWFL
jgi:hypothetical protein